MRHRINPFAGSFFDEPFRELANAAEDAVAHVLRFKGWSVTKRGWPDFFCLDDQGRMTAVEVKQIGQPLKASQIRVLRALEAHGIRCLVAKVDAEGHGSLQRFSIFRHASPRHSRMFRGRLVAPIRRISDHASRKR